MREYTLRGYLRAVFGPRRSAIIHFFALATLINVAAVIADIGIIDTKNDRASEAANSAEAAKQEKGKEGRLWVRIWDSTDKFSTIATAVFTGLLVYVTGRLVTSTNKLWDAGERQLDIAKKSARAAQLAAETARDSLTKLERAFVYCSEQSVTIPVPDDDKSPFIIQLKAVNTGKTWTKWAKAYSAWQAFNGGVPINYQFPNIGDGIPGSVFIGPGGSTFLGPLIIDREYMVAAIEGRSQIYIWAWVEYDDIFDGTQRHRTEFCAVVRPFHPPLENGIGKKTVAVGFHCHSRFNGADEDCTNPIETGSPKNPLPENI